jgi:hypothetical protein
MTVVLDLSRLARNVRMRLEHLDVFHADQIVEFSAHSVIAFRSRYRGRADGSLTPQ